MFNFNGASNLAEGVDNTFIFIFSVAFFFIIAITGFMIWTLFRFNRKKGIPAKQFEGSNTLEMIWIAIPLAIVMVMFWFGWKGFAPMRKVPEGAMEISAIGRMWEWEFDYGNNLKSKDLVLPINKPVKINLKSEDVNHSLFIPAFRVKEDVIPGYDNYLWFIPTIIGEYEILCTEYCGLLHSSMLAKARVMEEADYEKWLAEFKATGPAPEPDGYLLLRNTGCIACHSLDGNKLVGPSFKGLYGSQKAVITGSGRINITVDDAYIIKSVYEPDVEIVEGYSKGLMQSYSNTLTEDDLKIIIDYLKTIGETN